MAPYLRTGIDSKEEVFWEQLYFPRKDTPFPEQLKKLTGRWNNFRTGVFSQEDKHPDFLFLFLFFIWYFYFFRKSFPRRRRDISLEQLTFHRRDILLEQLTFYSRLGGGGVFRQNSSLFTEVWWIFRQNSSLSQKEEILQQQSIFHRSRSRPEQVKIPRSNTLSEHHFIRRFPSGCFLPKESFPKFESLLKQIYENIEQVILVFINQNNLLNVFINLF